MQTKVGVAHSAYVTSLVREEPRLLDFVEIPFEQLVHAPDVIEVQQYVPVILHCASLSIAGNLPPDGELIERLRYWIEKTQTPWLGEHLAYVRTDGVWKEVAEHTALSPRKNVHSQEQAFNVGYTVSPQFSIPVLERVQSAAHNWSRELKLPILLENGPIYFAMPGSSISQFAFIDQLCARSPDVRLLLDLAHLAVTCENLNLNPFSSMEGLPLDRVVEVHISGFRKQSGMHWDDHTEPAPSIVFELLERLLCFSSPSAVTLEYNWDANFSRAALRRDVERVRGLLAAGGLGG